MAAERWQEIERHLLSVLTLSPAERQAYFDRACGEDREIRRTVESLLASEAEMGSFLEKPPAGGIRGTLLGSAVDVPAFEAGQCIGPYRILREIGRGGMSVVFLAEREDPSRQVALKVIKRGMDSDEIQRRFFDERQILAHLNHPSIAQLYDGGTTADGLPFFVMEHIEGEPIDRFCDRYRLSIDDRIELFRQVCTAVHYAHQNLVVHRDIKPGNILVTADGVPKLLDFGIAKLLDPDLTPEKDQPTAAWMRLMTPNYASPEQIGGGAITTASDVYSLGVLLYELLTGRLPYRIRTGFAEEIDLIFRGAQHVKPSVVVTQTTERESGGWACDPQELSQARATQPAKLAKRLRGDLDNIVRKALQIQPQRRYSSVEQLSDDLWRSRQGLTISAREDTFGYRAKTFLRRHKLKVTLAATVAALIVAFAVTALVQSLRVDRERRQTEQAYEFLIALFDTSAAGFPAGDSVTARQLLDRGMERIERDLEDQPETRATLMGTIGRAYGNLQFYDRAIPLLEESLHHDPGLGDAEPLAAANLFHLARAQRGAGSYDASERNYETALALRHRLDGPSSVEISEILHDLGQLRVAQGELQAAADFARQAVSMRRDLLGREHVATAHSKALLARCLRDLGENAEAEAMFAAAITGLRRASSEDPELALALNDLGFLLATRGDLRAAESSIRESLEIRRQIFGEDHPIYAESLEMLAFLLKERRDYEAAVPLLRKSLDVSRRRLGAEHPLVAKGQVNLANSLAEMGAYEEAEALYRQTSDLALRLVDEGHPRVALMRVGLADVLHAQGELEEAEALYRKAVGALQSSVGDQHYFLAEARLGLGAVLVDRGAFEVAEEYLRKSLPILEGVLGDGHWTVAQVRSELAGCLLSTRNLSEAEDLLLASYPILESSKGGDAWITRRARERVHRLHRLQEKVEGSPIS